MKTLTRVIDWTVKAVCFAILVYFALIRGPELVEMAQAQRGLFESRVNASGLIQSKSRYTVTAFTDGKIKRPNFKVGDPITQGSVVVEILVGDKYENIRAAVSGVVSKVFQENGGEIERKGPILEISDPEHMEMLTDLPPSDAEQVHVGDEITISKWGGPEPLHGSVARIGKAENGVTTIQVSGALKDVPEDIFKKLGSRSQVPVSIQVAKFPDALKLPLGAVFRSKETWAVFKVIDRRARKKNVTILNRNNEEVMIGEGLADGESVIVHPGALVKDSVRVEMK